MLKLAWLTDLHLNFLPPERQYAFIKDVAGLECDAVLLGGDFAQAESLLSTLRDFDDMLTRPAYFVLGNHDFYNGSIASIRKLVKDFCRSCRHLTYLPGAGVIRLSESTCLVGCDGWGDGRCGDFSGTKVIMTDHFCIKELSGLDRPELLRRLAGLGDEAAEYLRGLLPEALAEYKHVIVVTHVPPFREACWHEGRISEDDYLPFFVCVAVGELLRETMIRNPGRQMTVLCGHSHGEGVAQILDNLVVKTGGAVYGVPRVQEILQVD